MIRFFIFLQYFIEKSSSSLLSLIRILVLSRKPSIYPSTLKNEIVILANGPSLNKMIEKHGSFLENKECICVNFFPTTNKYDELKPRFTILSAPELWRETAPDNFRELSTNLFSAMRDKTTWQMIFFIPCEARKWEKWKEIIKTNKNISICYYNNTPVEGWKWLSHLLYDLKCGMPRPQNILIPSIHILLAIGYKKIYLWGADHSWLKEISVDDQNNALVNQKHFYDENASKPATMHKAGTGKRRLHEILYKFMKSFESYFVLRNYAEYKNASVINNTPGSFIDAFTKERLE